MKAFITGINGQDGSYLAELLISKGYEVFGIIRRNSVSENQTFRINKIIDKIKLFYGDVTDLSCLISVIKNVMPDEVYNLAAQSHVKVSFEQPISTANITGIGSLNVFEAVRLVCPNAKIYQASSSEMFGNNIDEDGFQRETTAMKPVSPYGCAKLYAHRIAINYRHSYGMFISNGILFNHESYRRGSNFVTSKVVQGAVSIYLGKSSTLNLGNLNATRDWGYAKEYVSAMWLMLQQDKADDFVCATGVSHSVRDLCKLVFEKLGMHYENYVNVDEKYFRPEELVNLKGDASKLYKTTQWKPKVSFEEMIYDMIEHYIIQSNG
jgi:GDPmannose 4,6-dehydratase